MNNNPDGAQSPVRVGNPENLNSLIYCKKMPKTKKEFIALLAKRMNADEKITNAWIDACTETLIDIFKTGEGVTLNGLGGFYLARKYGSTLFKFNPSQRLRKLFGWSSTHKGEV